MSREKAGDLGVEGFAAGGLHEVGALHGAARRREGAAAGVAEAFARTEHGLLADDAGAAHLLHVTVLVGDAPVARPQLDAVQAPLMISTV